MMMTMTGMATALMTMMMTETMMMATMMIKTATETTMTLMATTMMTRTKMKTKMTTMSTENSRILISYFFIHHYEQVHCTKSELKEIPGCEPITSHDVGVSLFLPIAQTDMWMVQITYICMREFSSKRNGTRNIGTHFRCKPWTKFRPRCGPIKR